MKNIEKHLLTVGLVALGVVAAGLAMNAFKDSEYVADARKGFGAV